MRHQLHKKATVRVVLALCPLPFALALALAMSAWLVWQLTRAFLWNGAPCVAACPPAQTSLNGGIDLKTAVELPADEEYLDWLAVHGKCPS